MRTLQERYFISNILFPLHDLNSLLSNAEQLPTYFDDQYSPLKEKIGNICEKVLHLFEQPVFSEVHGIKKRNELNNSDSSFHRILSYGIKEKHGNVNSKYYSDTNLTLPCGAYYHEEDNKYDYGYTPIILNGGNSFYFLDDIDHVILSLIQLYKLNLSPIQTLRPTTKKFDVVDDSILLRFFDRFKYWDDGMANSANIRTYTFQNLSWVPADLPLQISWCVVDDIG